MQNYGFCSFRRLWDALGCSGMHWGALGCSAAPGGSEGLQEARGETLGGSGMPWEVREARFQFLKL